MKTELENAIEVLEKGELILYPTATVWGIGCDATNPNAVEKIYKLKNRTSNKALICLVSGIEMLKEYLEDSIPLKALEIIRESEQPITIIYSNPKGIARNLVLEDNTLAVRIAKDDFCRELIKNFEKPIVSTSANISGHHTPKAFEQIDSEIAKGVDYIVNLYREPIEANPSKIIKINLNGDVIVVRE